MRTFVESFYQWYRNSLRNTRYRWLIILGTLVYLFSPIDISPDFIPVIGWIDDGVLITLLVTEGSQLLMEQLNRRSRNRAPEPTEVADFPPTVDVEVS